jgi:hypothetical protein
MPAHMRALADVSLVQGTTGWCVSLSGCPFEMACVSCGCARQPEAFTLHITGLTVLLLPVLALYIYKLNGLN